MSKTPRESPRPWGDREETKRLSWTLLLHCLFFRCCGVAVQRIKGSKDQRPPEAAPQRIKGSNGRRRRPLEGPKGWRPPKAAPQRIKQSYSMITGTIIVMLNGIMGKGNYGGISNTTMLLPVYNTIASWSVALGVGDKPDRFHVTLRIK